MLRYLYDACNEESMSGGLAFIIVSIGFWEQAPVHMASSEMRTTMQNLGLFFLPHLGDLLVIIMTEVCA